MLHELDDIASDSATTADEALFANVDREPIMSAAHRARPASVDPAFEPNAAPRDLILDADGTGTLEATAIGHVPPPSAGNFRSQPMKLRPSSWAARITTKEPAAGSTTRSPGCVTAPINRVMRSIGFTCG